MIIEFPGRRHFEFYDVLRLPLCRYCFSAEVLLCETIEQPYYVMKSKMAALGNLKAKIGDTV